MKTIPTNVLNANINTIIPELGGMSIGELGRIIGVLEADIKEMENLLGEKIVKGVVL